MQMLQTERSANPINSFNLPPHGFGEFEVPEMPAFIQGYSKRGNQYDGETTPVYQQARWGNKKGKGGMNAYLSQAEDDTYLEGYKVKKGNAGVYEYLRWSPGQDFRGNFGIASLSESKNYAGIPTRGGQLRKGGPKRSDYIDRKDYWFSVTRPGIQTGRYTQKNNNYAGLYEYKKQTPRIELSNDMLDLRSMIENCPWNIPSHGAKQAKAIYDKEFHDMRSREVPAYQNHVDNAYVQKQIDRPFMEMKETSPYLRPAYIGGERAW